MLCEPIHFFFMVTPVLIDINSNISLYFHNDLLLREYLYILSVDFHKVVRKRHGPILSASFDDKEHRPGSR